jgi:hypothetical protein
MKTMRAKNNAPKNLVIILSLASLIALSLSRAQESPMPVQGGAVSQDVNSMSDAEVMLQAEMNLGVCPQTHTSRNGALRVK